ncbi:MAG: DUF421 domain-containing protein [Oscillospiraceae bacterium]|nr:DUF421 domain-containing protein [Oscillospiraceae bacterium]
MKLYLVPLTTLLSLIILFLISKLIGYRQVSSMSLYDYINSVTIGSLAAQLSIAEGNDIWRNVIAMSLYGIFTLACAILTNKSKKARNIIEGCPIILMDKGVLYKNRMKKAHIDTDELVGALRVLGHFDISKLNSVVLETNGKISALPKAGERPSTPNDLSISVPEESIWTEIISDGKIDAEKMRMCGIDMNRLNKKLSECSKTADEIFLAVCDSFGNICFFPKKYTSEKSAI